MKLGRPSGWKTFLAYISRRPVYVSDFYYSAWLRRAYIFIAIAAGICLLVVWFVFGSSLVDPFRSGKPLSNVVTTSIKTYTVIKVIDGDTIDIKGDNGATERVRLIGIDTPEKYVSPVECYAEEASSNMADLVLNKSVSIEADSSQDAKDKYGRSLYYIWLDGTNVNNKMVLDGFAYEYTYDKAYKYQAEFKNSQENAKSKKLGVWSSACDATGAASEDTGSTESSTKAVTSSSSVDSSCNPNYTPCVPNVSYDLDCPDISTSVTVIGTDVYRFDRDHDGYGCENN